MKQYLNLFQKNGFFLWAMAFLLLSSCGKPVTQEEQWQASSVQAREYYTTLSGATALCHVTADYGARIYDFSMSAEITREENGIQTTLTLTSPAEVSGIAVTQTGGSSFLQWEDLILETGYLANQSPVTVLHSLLQQLESGYLLQCSGKEMFTPQGSVTVLELLYGDPDVPLGEGLTYEIWLVADTLQLLGGDVYQDGVRVLQCALEEFTIEAPQQEL